MVDINKRLVEVNEVLIQLPEEEYNKIPKEVISNITNNMDKNYNWKYNNKEELSKQGLCKDTIAILSYINLKYLLNEEQKNLMEQVYINNEIKKQKELREKFNTDNIFNNKQEEIQIETNDLPAEVKKETFFEKLVNFIKRIFIKD